MVMRKEYLDRIIAFREKKVIKVVTGVRRCGKSSLFTLYQEYLKSTGVIDAQIISLNLEDLEYSDLLDYNELYIFIKTLLRKDTYMYVFLDEVQNCDGFERVVDSLFIKDNVDVYITGSNAHMLSGDLATLLSGRYVTINMLPLSFEEYYRVKVSGDVKIADLINEYIQFGSLPYIVTTPQDVRSKHSYIDGVYNTILVKDVAKREGISDIPLLESIVKTIASSVGSPISTKKISDTINSSGRRISVNTVDNYLKALTDSFIFYKVDRYDIKGRNYLKTLGKYYVVDTGIRNLLLSTQSQDLGHQIENIVYFELLRRGYKVHVGKIGENEIDFVCHGMDDILYVQVSASVLDEKTLQRELFPLQKIRDNHPKLLLTLDEIGAGANHNGIRQYYLIDWLLKRV